MGLLYVVGGYYEKCDDDNAYNRYDERISSVEIYDPSTNNWSMEKLSESTIDMVSGVIVDKSPNFIVN